MNAGHGAGSHPPLRRSGATVTRRIALLALAAAAQQLHAQGSTPDAGRLYDPSATGRPRARTRAADADAEIQAIEQRLACHCGCTLDIFTCRTTDFTCTVSPALHREVVALYESGADAQAIIDAFAEKYGEQALMAPEARGFNLLGYVVPGALILCIGSALAWVIGRRFRLASTDADMAAGIRMPELAAGAAGADAEERLRQALAEVED